MRYGKASERLYRGAPSVYNGKGGEDPKISASPVVHFSSTSDEHISLISIVKDRNAIWFIIVQVHHRDRPEVLIFNKIKNEKKVLVVNV